MWNQFVVVLLGLWLMASPDVMGYEGPEQTNNHIVGPLVVSLAVIAVAETTRAVRWINVALGLWLILAPILLRYHPLHIGVRSSLLGAAVLLLSLMEGERREQLGGGWSRLWTRDAQPHPPEDSQGAARRKVG